MSKTKDTLPFLPDTEDGPAVQAGAEPGWLADLRRAGLAVYRDRGLPTVRVEAFKYTGLAGLTKTPFALDDGTLPAPPETPAGVLDLAEAMALTLVNGRLVAPPDALPEGVQVDSLARLLEDDPAALEPHLGRVADLSAAPMGALNAALMADGLVIRVAAGTTLDRPLHVVSMTDAPDGARHMHPRHLIVMGEGASATVIESRVTADGAAETLSNALTEVVLGQGARLVHPRLVNPGSRAVDLDLTAVDVAEGATYEAFTLTLGGRLVRNEGHVHLGGAQAHARLHGAYGASDGQHLDTTLVVDHAVPDTRLGPAFQGCRGCRRARRVPGQGDRPARCPAQRRQPASQGPVAGPLGRGLYQAGAGDLRRRRQMQPRRHRRRPGRQPAFLSDVARHPRGRARALLVEAFLDDVVTSLPAGPLREAFLGAVRSWQASREAEGRA